MVITGWIEVALLASGGLVQIHATQLDCHVTSVAYVTSLCFFCFIYQKEDKSPHQPIISMGNSVLRSLSAM